MNLKQATVDGINLTVDADNLNDYDLVECIAICADEEASENEQLSASFRMFRLFFGDDYQRIKKELRDKNDGVLTVENVTRFFTDVLDAISAKN